MPRAGRREVKGQELIVTRDAKTQRASPANVVYIIGFPSRVPARTLQVARGADRRQIQLVLRSTGSSMAVRELEKSANDYWRRPIAVVISSRRSTRGSPQNYVYATNRNCIWNIYCNKQKELTMSVGLL